MTLPVYNSGLSAFSSALTQEGVVSVGQGKFVIISHGIGPNSEVGYIVVQLDQAGVPTFGTPAYFASTVTNVNPMAYYDSSQDKVVILYDNYPANKYIITSVSGMALNEVSRGAHPSITADFAYAVSYNRVAGAAAMAAIEYSPDTIQFYSLKLSGSSLSVNQAPVGVPGGVYNDNCKIAPCGSYSAVGFTNTLNYPNSEMRVLSGIGTGGFQVSAPGSAVPLAAHEYCLGLTGSDDGLFTGYWSDGTATVPTLIAGDVSSGSVLFGATGLQYSCPNWGQYFGKFIGGGDGAGSGISAFAYRVQSTFVHMFSTEVANLEVSISDESTSASGLPMPSANYDHVSVALDAGAGLAMCAFPVNVVSSPFDDIYIASLAVNVPQPPVPLFWKNHTLQEEGVVVAGQLTKKPTIGIIPGSIGQAYIPETPAVPSKIVTNSGTQSVCQRVF